MVTDTMIGSRSSATRDRQLPSCEGHNENVSCHVASLLIFALPTYWLQGVYYLFIYLLLLKSYPKYKIDRDRNKAHDTDKNITT